MMRELASGGHDPVGVVRASPGWPGRDSAQSFVECDLLQSWPRLGEIDAIVHLAGLSAVGPSFGDPQRYLDVNSRIVTNLGQAQLDQAHTAPVLIVSSGAVYAHHSERALVESDEIASTSPYAVSKTTVENLATYYRGRGLRWITVRPFNHIGPGQGPGFIVPDLYDAVVSSLSHGAPIEVGDLDTRRDYTDVRDVVRAYRLLLEQPDIDGDVFNVCSGVSTSGRQILESLRGHLGEVAVAIDRAKLRPNDPREIRGSAQRLFRCTGWKPVFKLEQSVTDFVRVRGAGGI